MKACWRPSVNNSDYNDIIMAGFSDRLNAMKAAQEAAALKKQEEAAEKSRQESEAKKGELAKRRESLGTELASAEQEAGEASKAIAEAEAFAAEQGAELDSAAKEEIEAIKQEAAAVMAKYESLKSELSQIDAEMGGSEGAEASDETAATEAPTEASTTEEAPVETAASEAPTEAPVAEAETSPEKEFNPETASLEELASIIDEKFFSAEAERKLETAGGGALLKDLSKVDHFKPAPPKLVEQTHEVMSSLAAERSELLKLGAIVAEKRLASDESKLVKADEMAGHIMQKMESINSRIEWLSRQAQGLNGASNVPKSAEVTRAARARMASGEDVGNFLRLAEASAKSRGAKTAEEIAKRGLESLDTSMLGNRPGGWSNAADLDEGATAFLRQKYEKMDPKKMAVAKELLKGIVERAERYPDSGERF